MSSPSVTDTDPIMSMQLEATGTKISLQFMITGKLGYEEHNVKKDNYSAYRNEALGAVVYHIINNTTNWTNDPGSFPLANFSCSYTANSFIITTDASFLPVMKRAIALQVTVQNGVYFFLRAGQEEYQVKSKGQHVSSYLWAHVSASNATDFEELVAQSIKKEFAKAGLDTSDIKAQFGDMGQAMDRYHVAFGIDRDTGIIPEGMMRLKNKIKLPSEVIAYTRLSREFLQKHEIKDCCFAMPHFNSTKYPNTYCTCSSAKKTVRVGNKREMQDQARRRIMDKQARGN